MPYPLSNFEFKHYLKTMKKIAILCLTLCFLACGTSKTVRQSKKTIKGDWTLTSIKSSAIGDLHGNLYQITIQEHIPYLE